jgi:hypothetical protein
VIQRVFTSVVVVAVALGLACVDMSAPNGPASISGLKLPSPFVALGDVMRDSTGTPAPLTIIAYDANGQPTATAAQFFITDTTKSAHLNGDATLVGDKIGATIIVGQIGSLQTSPVTVPVTYAPAKMAKSGADTTFVAPLTGDTSVTAVYPLSLKVTSAADSASQGTVVKYALLRTLSANKPTRVPVFIADNSGKPASADTTSSSGLSTRRLVVVPAFLADAALLAGTKTDTLIVEARASYKGAPLQNSPVQFVIPIRVQLK